MTVVPYKGFTITIAEIGSVYVTEFSSTLGPSPSTPLVCDSKRSAELWSKRFIDALCAHEVQDVCERAVHQ